MDYINLPRIRDNRSPRVACTTGDLFSKYGFRLLRLSEATVMPNLHNKHLCFYFLCVCVCVCCIQFSGKQSYETLSGVYAESSQWDILPCSISLTLYPLLQSSSAVMNSTVMLKFIHVNGTLAKVYCLSMSC